MQNVSATYRRIFADPLHWFETSVVIGESGRLLDQLGNVLLFGGDAILVDIGGPDGGFTDSQLIEVETSHSLFEGTPSVGNCYSGEIDVTMLAPIAEIPRMARIQLFTRVANAAEHSEWLPKGVYFIDTRDTTQNNDDLDILSFHGYDAMMRAEADYPSDTGSYPKTDIQVVRIIAQAMQVGVDSRTVAIMTRGYRIELPSDYSMREVLSYIGAMYGGNWIINDVGDLRLIPLTSIPSETSYLTDSVGQVITFGKDFEHPNEEVRILVNR